MHELVKVLANTKAQRWVKLAFILSLRKYVMDQINGINDVFEWNGLLDINACIDAKKLIDMNDFYIVGLALVPVSNKGRSGYCTPKISENNVANDQNHLILVHEFKTKIIKTIVANTSPMNEFKISTSELTKKLPRARYEQLCNMDYIRYIIEELGEVKLLTAYDPPNKKAKNRKYSKIIKRNKIINIRFK